MENFTLFEFNRRNKYYNKMIRRNVFDWGIFRYSFFFSIQLKYRIEFKEKLLAFLNYSPLILFPPFSCIVILSCRVCRAFCFFPFMIVKMKNPTLCEQLFLHLEATGFTFFLYIHTQHTYITTNNNLAAAASIHTVHKYIYYVMFVDVFKGVDFYYP